MDQKKGRYGASITLDDGTRRYFYGKKRQDVYEKLPTALREQQEGTLIDVSQQTIAQYLKDWLEHSAKDRIRSRTFCGGRAKNEAKQAQHRFIQHRYSGVAKA